MRGELFKVILAVVAVDRSYVGAAGAPLFLAENREEAQRKADRIARILDAMVHDLGDDTFMVVRH